MDRIAEFVGDMYLKPEYTWKERKEKEVRVELSRGERGVLRQPSGCLCCFPTSRK